MVEISPLFFLAALMASPKTLKSYNGTGVFIIVHFITFYSSPFFFGYVYIVSDIGLNNSYYSSFIYWYCSFGLSEHRVQKLCKEIRITDIVHLSSVWLISKGTKKPIDTREKSEKLIKTNQALVGGLRYGENNTDYRR